MPLETMTTIAELRDRLKLARRTGKSVGLVPTMGYLHRGHAALVDRARAENDLVVTSIFVNPLQFGPNEDFARYPRDLDADRELLAAHGADFVFAPSVDEMYPHPIATHIEVETLSSRMEGERRPGHFRGVATVVGKLFNIVQPDRAYFGEKDYQQLQVIRRMVADLSFGLTVVGVPTVRDVDGVALSSRNVYLSPEERSAAPVLSRSLQAAAELIGIGITDPQRIEAAILNTLAAEALAEPDLVAVAAADTLEPVNPKAPPSAIALMIAVRIGRTRLIDQRVVAVP